MGMNCGIVACLSVAIFVVMMENHTANANAKTDCFKGEKLMEDMKELKKNCTEPFDYNTCLAYYECAARFYKAWDEEKKTVIFKVLKATVMKNAVEEDAAKMDRCLDECYEQDSGCGIKFNECFAKKIKENCPKLMQFAPEPPDCSKSSEEK